MHASNVVLAEPCADCGGAVLARWQADERQQQLIITVKCSACQASLETAINLRCVIWNEFDQVIGSSPYHPAEQEILETANFAAKSLLPNLTTPIPVPHPWCMVIDQPAHQHEPAHVAAISFTGDQLELRYDERPASAIPAWAWRTFAVNTRQLIQGASVQVTAIRPEVVESMQTRETARHDIPPVSVPDAAPTT